MKPKKETIYDKEMQDRIYKTVKKIVLKIIKNTPGIIKANAFGTIVRKEIGVYEKKYKNKRYGSDIDIACLTEKNFKAPKNWKLVHKWKGFDEYNVGSVENYIRELGKKELPIHPIKFLIIIPERHDYEDAKKWAGIDEEYCKKHKWPVENWFIK